ncbi:hypothetical protein CXT94_04905 [Akkermansia muciniphila]|nr:hypothetical protein CXT94_04905 [Akkermansia muciniphila]
MPPVRVLLSSVNGASVPLLSSLDDDLLQDASRTKEAKAAQQNFVVVGIFLVIWFIFLMLVVHPLG